MFDVITIGGATRDIFFKTDDDWIFKNGDPLKPALICLEYGAKIIPKEVHFSFGGGAVNAAISFSRLGLKTGTIISLGNDENSDIILKHLKNEKVNVSQVKCHGACRTGSSVFIVDKKGDHTALLYRGNNDNLRIKDWSFLKNTKYIYITSLTGDSDKILSDLEKRLNPKVKIAWNPGSVQLKKGFKGLKNLLLKTDVLILNKDEAFELVLSKIKDHALKGVEDAVLELKCWGPKIVVVTDGKNGAYAFDGKYLFFVPPLKTRLLDSTGAGDAFGSSFIAGLEIYKKDIKKSLALAMVNASSVVSHYGAQNGLLKIDKAEDLETKAQRLIKKTKESLVCEV